MSHKIKSLNGATVGRKAISRYPDRRVPGLATSLSVPAERGHLLVRERISFLIEPGGDGRPQAVEFSSLNRKGPATMNYTIAMIAAFAALAFALLATLLW